MMKNISMNHTLKAVTEGVRNPSILDLPRGSWHQWIEEVFNFMKKNVLQHPTLFGNLYSQAQNKIVHKDSELKLVPIQSTRVNFDESQKKEYTKNLLSQLNRMDYE